MSHAECDEDEALLMSKSVQRPPATARASATDGESVDAHLGRME